MLLLHDRDRDEHYNVISAFIKSLRASDPDAALYYLARMLEAGEDPLFLARRLVIFASEDVGNADPQALPLATITYQAVERLGMPEARIPLAQADRPTSPARPRAMPPTSALGRARRGAGANAVRSRCPLHLRNAPTRLMKETRLRPRLRVSPRRARRFVAARNLPDALGDVVFYEPTARGAEAAMARDSRSGGSAAARSD